MSKATYDLIFTGLGMANLSLLYRGYQSGIFKGKRILAIDKISERQNDKTWCFWAKDPGPFKEVIFRQWQDLHFFTHNHQHLPLQTEHYAYHMIRSIDFYHHCLFYLRNCAGLEIIEEEVLEIFPLGAVRTSHGYYEGEYVINSIFEKPEINQEVWLWQHFKGWTIKVEEHSLKANEAYLMDFRTGQEEGTTFFYVLPFSRNEIFIEYTFFSPHILPNEKYDDGLTSYIKNVLGIESYEILHTEFGAIPMTNFPFLRQRKRILNIGSIGGDTRGSTGYTFMNTQKTIDRILWNYKQNGYPFFNKEVIGPRAKLFDSTILKVLQRNQTYNGAAIFADLFAKIPAHQMFKFLDAETNLWEDLQVMWAVQARHFMGPFVSAILGR
ncbi:lycopene cyclase family protein [Persicobacter diffluens]|uniref:Lycopene cyclase n=1 Tax=Persicobacter diffluens TaxID=981 RepID=A0AAN4W214_9BACT|nr:lycopene cyclase [Persicobacter diffluens]